MQELSGLRANFYKIPQEDGPDRAEIELIIVTSEPTYSLSNTHDVVRDRECQTHRVAMTREGARAMIESLEGLISELDELVESESETD